MGYGLAQLSVRTDHNKESLIKKRQRRRQREHHLKVIYRLFEITFYACKMLSSRPNRLTHVVPNLNPLGIKHFVSGISISFKCECTL